jgi:hypothetical protein
MTEVHNGATIGRTTPASGLKWDNAPSGRLTSRYLLDLVDNRFSSCTV